MHFRWETGPSAATALDLVTRGSWSRKFRVQEIRRMTLLPDLGAWLGFIPLYIQLSINLCVSDLPYGWEQETDENGQLFFVE